MDREDSDSLRPEQRVEVADYYARKFNRAWEFKQSGAPERRSPKKVARRWRPDVTRWPVHEAPAATRSPWPESYIAERSEAWRRARGLWARDRP